MWTREGITRFRIRLLSWTGVWDGRAAHEFHEKEIPGDFKAWNMSYRVSMEVFSVFCLILAVFFTQVSLRWDICYIGNSTVYWFQRSGALLVATSAFVEFVSLGDANGYRTFERRWVHPVRRALTVIGFGFLGLGTVIWAYGDLLVDRFLKPIVG